MSVMIHVWVEITDVIDNAEKLLNLPFGKLLIWKVKQFLGNVLSWLVVSIMYHNTSSVVSLVGSRVKPVRNRFSGWKVEKGKGSVTR